MARALPIRRKNKRLDAYILTKEELYRPRDARKTIDLETIEALAAIGATNEEIAIAIGCSGQWITNQIHANPAVAIAIERGTVALKHSLRRCQVQMALSGSVPLLIWLGKQYLGQADKHEQNNKTEISVTVQRATEELRAIPRDRLLESLAVMNAPVTIENASADDDAGIVPVAE